MLMRLLYMIVYKVIEFPRRVNIYILKNLGLEIGNNVFIGANVTIDKAFPWLIKIGDNCTLTEDVVILAHDASTKKHLGYTKVKTVSIGNNVFIGARSIVLPGANIGDNVIIGAGSVVAKSIPKNTVAFGNPIIIACSIEEYLDKHRINLNLSHIYEHGWTLDSGINDSKKKKMKHDLQDCMGYSL